MRSGRQTKRPLYLLALSMPLMLGAAPPPMLGPVRPIPQMKPADVVEVNVLDRFLQDSGLRKRSTPSKRTRTRTPANRSAIPAAPPLAAVPVPTPKPQDEATAASPAQPAAAPQTTDPAPDAKVEKQAAMAAAETAEKQKGQDRQSPETSPVRPDETKTAENPAPPTVEQPATAVEPAHPAEVPKPQAKPETSDTASGQPKTGDHEKPDTSANGQQQPPKDAAHKDEPRTTEKSTDKTTDKSTDPGKQEPADDAAAPDGKGKANGNAKGEEKGQAEADGNKQTEDEQKAEASPPPPPLVKEDPEELKACLSDLAAIGAKFEPTDPIDDGHGCGIEHPIDVAQVLPGVDLGGATMRCKTALTMAHWLKDTVQPALNIAMPGRHITGLVPGSTYECRLRNGASTGKISEHARGNAYDVAAFKLDNGEKIEMKPRNEDSTLEGAFQRTATAGACLHFTTVLSPGSDAAHETHLHLDVLERKGGYRYCR
ncbi:extensin family protein [Neorhizobium sp. NCHU2750]|uniref:extensin family protein n=1 Tax=Neorhizobium sp. NCHU2750 TaxID=1825976 RepID=UPI000EB65641|nr:extensin [Neorhizobium sp. NCHU2750]